MGLFTKWKSLLIINYCSFLRRPGNSKRRKITKVKTFISNNFWLSKKNSIRSHQANYSREKAHHSSQRTNLRVWSITDHKFLETNLSTYDSHKEKSINSLVCTLDNNYIYIGGSKGLKCFCMCCLKDLLIKCFCSHGNDFKSTPIGTNIKNSCNIEAMACTMDSKYLWIASQGEL
jgi:hypothetical protein